MIIFFFSSRRRHTRFDCDWSSDVCSSDLMSGEAASRANIDLPGVQPQLLEAISATGTPIVLVVMSGRPLTIPWAAEHVPAIVESWFLGIGTGPALAAVLFGDVGPAGKLPATFPR